MLQEGELGTPCQTDNDILTEHFPRTSRIAYDRLKLIDF